MSALAHHEILYLLLGLSILLGLARLFGEIAKWLRQPSVVGEILAGILLGPTVFGALAPEIQGAIFPVGEGGLAAALEGLTTIAVVLFLLIAGMEVDLSIVWRQGKAALSVGLVGMAIPFLAGLALAALFPGFLGLEEGTRPLVFTLFLATALSISALPVVAKILLDLNIFRSDLGMVMVAAAIVNDLLGWMVFAVVLAMMGTVKVAALSIPMVIVLTLAFAFLMLVVVRLLLDKALPYLYAYASWPGGVLSFICAGAFFFAAVTEWIGVHAIFGAFLFGCALGDSRHLRERTRATLENFVSFIFVPLFFASIGLKVDFLKSFDLGLVVVVCVVATVSKVLGSALGAHWAGMSRRESWAMGFGLNARGAMEIILGLLALEAGVINERLFVALVTMALLTSMTSGTLLERALQRRRPMRLVDRVAARHFVPSMEAQTRDDAIRELAENVAPSTGRAVEEIASAVLARESLMSTGIGNRVAIPHARLEGLKAPLVVIGRSECGIDFDAPDGRDARIVFLILTSTKSYSDQLEILADISRALQRPDAVDKVLAAESYAELLVLLKVESGGEHAGG